MVSSCVLARPLRLMLAVLTTDLSAWGALDRLSDHLEKCIDEPRVWTEGG